MRRTLLGCAFAISLVAVVSARQASVRDYPIRAVPLQDVEITGGFWGPRLETNRTVTIPHIMRQNELTGRVANFERAAGRESGDYQGRRFNDTDVYKTIEAASYSLLKHPDPALEKQLDAVIDAIAAAQEKDGYIYPARTVKSQKPVAGIGPERWVNLNGSHELYNFGHLYEAAVAHHAATGKRTLLDVAIKNASLVRATFGPDKRRAVPGHEEIELALVRLYRTTGDEHYLQLAKFFLDQRGGTHQTQPYPADSPFAIYNGREYMQDHLPVARQKTAVGHAVRATYLYSAMTDIAALMNDAAYRQALDAIWKDIVSSKMYLTGGIGARAGSEAFGDPYELPNRKAYTETCASIGHQLWNHRMFLLHGDATYLDMFEQILYNGYLSGVSLSGDRFFYQNPLESDPATASGRNPTTGALSTERVPYFEVACCPSNLARVAAQLPGLVYAHTDRAVYVNLFVASRASVDVAGAPIRITQETRYPWDGAVTLRVDPAQPRELALKVRVPGWARTGPVPSDLYRFVEPIENTPSATLNGTPVRMTVERGFLTIERRWERGDTVTLTLPMAPRRVAAHQGISENRGRLAVQRGPVVYAAEEVDNGGPISALVVPKAAPLSASERAGLLGGVTVVTGRGFRIAPDGRRTAQDVVLIPYYAWANRGRGGMAVWLKTE